MSIKYFNASMSLVIKKIKFPESRPSSFAGHKRRSFKILYHVKSQEV